MGRLALACFVVLSFAATAFAAAPVASPQLQKCLARVDALPDIAAAEATAWLQKGGGNDARLCLGFAQSNRGMHEDAAHEFGFLASFYEKHDVVRAVSMRDMAGHEFLRARDMKSAEAQYGRALQIMPGDVTGLIGHAEVLMASERYWDAIADLDRALTLNPGAIDALRQRGRAWTELGNDKNAQEDFEQAAALENGRATP